jgi:hypothetical protein
VTGSDLTAAGPWQPLGGLGLALVGLTGRLTRPGRQSHSGHPGRGTISKGPRPGRPGAGLSLTVAVMPRVGPGPAAAVRPGPRPRRPPRLDPSSSR